MWPQVAIAYVIDLIIGDPRIIPHPVVLIGRLISFLEKRLLFACHTRVQKKLVGTVVVAVVVALSLVATWTIVFIASSLSKWLGIAVSIWLISTAIATKGLMDSARDVLSALNAGRLSEARKKVSHIVGRDTEQMEPKEVVRATVETVAENSVDGVIAPIIFAAIGGAPLAMAYKAVNTLDSMIGYKNERYEDFGWAAAKLDDAANYIPARVSVAIISIAAFLCGRSAYKAIKVAVRDGGNHASPNSGLPEAAFAGAFGVRLGGTNYYAGIPRNTGLIGDGENALSTTAIGDAVRLVFLSSLLTVLLGELAVIAVGFMGAVR